MEFANVVGCEYFLMYCTYVHVCAYNVSDLCSVCGYCNVQNESGILLLHTSYVHIYYIKCSILIVNATTTEVEFCMKCKQGTSSPDDELVFCDSCNTCEFFLCGCIILYI